jgi:hypothetical protein
MQEIEEVERYLVDEFDRGTRILLMNDGSLRIRLDVAPPSWPQDGAFDGFQAALERALGVHVEGLDKELYAISTPPPDAVHRIKRFLIDFRAAHET